MCALLNEIKTCPSNLITGPHFLICTSLGRSVRNHVPFLLITWSAMQPRLGPIGICMQKAIDDITIRIGGGLLLLNQSRVNAFWYPLFQFPLWWWILNSRSVIEVKTKYKCHLVIEERELAFYRPRRLVGNCVLIEFFPRLFLNKKLICFLFLLGNIKADQPERIRENQPERLTSYRLISRA